MEKGNLKTAKGGQEELTSKQANYHFYKEYCRLYIAQEIIKKEIGKRIARLLLVVVSQIHHNCFYEYNSCHILLVLKWRKVEKIFLIILTHDLIPDL